ncbi:MAG: hypothetical protein RLZZ519_1661 [Bacteroidota bacterium]|jgi:hypothetical protein
MIAVIHLLLHALIPATVAGIAYRERFWRAFGIMVATMLVDLDHLLANPIFDPCRCSIGYHPLHTWPAILVYAALVVPKRTRLIGIGLLIHMALDQVDCWLM